MQNEKRVEIARRSFISNLLAEGTSLNSAYLRGKREASRARKPIKRASGSVTRAYSHARKCVGVLRRRVAERIRDYAFAVAFFFRGTGRAEESPENRFSDARARGAVGAHRLPPVAISPRQFRADRLLTFKLPRARFSYRSDGSTRSRRRFVLWAPASPRVYS